MAGRGSNEAPTMAVEVFSHSRRSCRRSIGLLLDMLHLQVPFAKFVREVVAGAPAQGHNGPRRILATGTDECATVDDKQILHVMRLLKLIENGSLWIGSQDRKSTRLNSSHLVISYAVFCLKKKNQTY